MSKKTTLDALEERVAKLEDDGVKGIKRVSRILIIQDTSGSMWSRRDETISGYNEYLEDLKNDDADEAYLTLIQFNVNYYVIEEETPINRAKNLTKSKYYPEGGTALLDAVGRGITELQNQLKDDERAFVIIMTDGLENRSKEYSKSAVQSLIRSCEREGNWTFTFLGAGQESWSGQSMLGLRRNQAAFYGNDAHSHQVAFASLASTTRSYRGGMQGQMVAPGATVSNLMAEEGASVQLENEGVYISTTTKDEIVPKTKGNNGEREGP